MHDSVRKGNDPGTEESEFAVITLELVP
jgi:hypothetical protein